jgi:transmembrane sensor
MSLSVEKNDRTDPAGLAAAEWVLRHDRGLSATEQDEFSHWLAADPRHRAAWAEHRWGWDELDRLAGLQTSVHAVPDPDLLAPRKRWRFGFPLSPSLSLSLLAAGLMFAFVLWERPWSRPPVPPSASPPGTPPTLALIEQRTLADDSIVELNRGAVVTERFTPGERRVQLARGEAHFKVAKDVSRPFIVEVAGIAVRAVGTAFNVRLDSAAVEVLVTEGQVSVAQPDMGGVSDVGGVPSPRGLDVPLVAAGERMIVSLAPSAPAPEVVALSSAEIEARLAWQPRLLDFTSAPLSEIVAEFNRRNPVRLTLGDASLAGLRLSVTFRSDNVEGFVRLMASDFDMRAERRGEAEITLVLAAPKPN